jgi:predicted enzyme related to lactoylglutathione lyase
MAHHSRLDQIVMDFGPAEHDAAVAFWGGALGRPFEQVKRYAEYHRATLEHNRIGILAQRLGDGQSRIHLDIHTDDGDAEVARLEALGAKRIEQINGWWIMQDPAGLPFCVIPDPSVNEENGHRWD